MSSLPTTHLVELRQYTGGVALSCHADGCDWHADINTGHVGPVKFEGLRGLSWEARALADAHRYNNHGQAHQ